MTVDAGTLLVNGDTHTFSSTTVNAGATLGGTGTVSATTISTGGMLAPGSTANPTGTLSVSGNLTFQSGSLYVVAVTPSSAASTTVSGNAVLSGGSVQAVFAPGSFVSKSYDILHAAGGFAALEGFAVHASGTTSNVVSPTMFSGVSGNLPAGFSESLSYTATDVMLNLSLNMMSGPTGLSDLNRNQQSAANAIGTFFNNGGTLTPGFVNLVGLSGSNLSNALSQVSGETATGSQQTTFDAMNLFMSMMTDPFMNRGGGNGSSSPLGYAAASNPTDAFAMFTKAPPQSFESRWSVWAAGFGGSQNTDGNAAAGTNNTTSSIASTAVGADYLISPNTIAGFALAGGGTNFSVANGGTGRSDLFQAGAYVRHTQGPAYISAALAYGWQDITTTRTVTVAGFDQLRAQFNANAWSGRLEGGYRFVAPATFGIGITPYAAAQFVTFDLPAYAEQAIVGTNNFALSYGAKDATDARAELGFRTDKSLADERRHADAARPRSPGRMTFDPDRSIGATFQTLPGASFVVNGAAQAADSALTTASIEMKWKNNWSVAATFEGEFSAVTASYAGKGVVRYAW